MSSKNREKTFGYSINLDERGYFEADVRNKDGVSIWSIDSASAMQLTDDFGIKNLRDPEEIGTHLREMSIIGHNDNVLSLTDAEKEWDKESYVELRICDFEGFYESEHDAKVDDAVEGFFEDDQGNSHVPDEWYSEFGYSKEMMEAYGEMYVGLIKDYLKDELSIELPSMEVVEVTSPKEYNFETNKLYVKVKFNELKDVFKSAENNPEKITALREKVEDMFKSRDGFISFYGDVYTASKKDDIFYNWFKEDDGETVKPIEHWDENELGVIFSGIIGKLDCQKVFDHYSGQSPIHELVTDVVWKNMSQKCKKMVAKFNDSLDSSSPAM